MPIVKNLKGICRYEIISFYGACVFPVSNCYRSSDCPMYDLLYVLHCNLYISVLLKQFLPVCFENYFIFHCLF
jgi:hypothetical protein